jgi:hypothetical protein
MLGIGGAPRVPTASDLQRTRGPVSITGAPWAQGGGTLGKTRQPPSTITGNSIEINVVL